MVIRKEIDVSWYLYWPKLASNQRERTRPGNFDIKICTHPSTMYQLKYFHPDY